GFLDYVREQFTHFPAVLPQSICFEITETAAIARLDQATRFINEMKSLGCRFSLDDFGAGMSSFAYLKHLPVDFLKIDGGLVKTMPQSYSVFTTLRRCEMGAMYELSPNPTWVDSLHGYVKPYWDALLNGDFAKGVSSAQLTVPEMQGWILQTYPFIHAFPKFLAEALIKVEDDYSRAFLIDNIRVEKAHAEHWIWMGMGFGLKREEMLDLAEGNKPVLRDVQSLTDWLWYINTKGSLAEAVAATSFA